MIRHIKALYLLLLTLIAGTATAQNGVNSPYSRYGFGLLSDQSTSANKGMGGISCGLRSKSLINVGNPASYSSIDSLTFLFDAGVTLQNANFSNGTLKTNAKNSSLDYLVMQFRIFKNMGLTAGFLPFSKINYNFATSQTAREDEEGTITSNETFSGDGGLNQAFIGVGTQLWKNLSVGVNLSYLWGDVNHSIINSYSNKNVWYNTRSYSSEIKSYKADVGVQYTWELDKKRAITVGATYSIGHNMNDNAYKMQYTSDESSGTSAIMDQRVDTIANAYQLPHSFGIGLTYVYDNRLTIGLDYTLQKWGSVKYPHFQSGSTAENNYEDWSFNNKSKWALGMEYIPDPTARSIFKRMRYRVGGYYTDPYVKVKGSDSHEFGVGGAAVMPILNKHSSKTSFLTLSAEYVNVSPKKDGLIKENYLKLGIGLTFGQTWFYKWKVQ